MDKLAADFIFDGDTLLENKVLIHEKGRILGIEEKGDHDQASIADYRGIICPGFINTHCHLELSHMKGRIDTGTGLLPFLQAVVGYRDIDEDIIAQAIHDGDQEMRKGGIVAVGDISNKLDTAYAKSQSPIAYHTFVEEFDFLQPSMTAQTIQNYHEVFLGQSRDNRNKVGYTPHAPYTVSAELFAHINKENTPLDVTVSIHNQETFAENQLFLEKKGGFISFFQSFGFAMDHFEHNNRTSIHYAMEHMDPTKRTLMVHNTLSTKEDIAAAQEWNKEVYWATCANANLYIENKLPDYQVFLDMGSKMTIGTDSLSSNWQLSIVEEIKTIAKFKSYVPAQDLLQWATKNGAEALGYGEFFGDFKVGKKPGINLIQDFHGDKIKMDLSGIKSTILVYS